MQATKMNDATRIPPSERLSSLARWYQTHSPETGRNDNRVVLVSAATPQSKPNCSHGFNSSFSSIVSVSQKIAASNSAARLVSQIQRVHQKITDGSRAQVQELQTATLSLKHFFAIRKIGMQVSAEKILLMVKRSMAEVRL